MGTKRPREDDISLNTSTGQSPMLTSQERQVKYSHSEIYGDHQNGKPKALFGITMLDQLHTLKKYNRVTVVVEAREVKDPEISNSQEKKVKQDILIADETGSCRLTLWESQIQTILEGKRYHLTNVVVREYKGEWFLSTVHKYPFKAEIIESDPVYHAEKVAIVGVKNFENFSYCSICGSVAHCDDDKELVECTECQMTQLKSSCRKKLKAELAVEIDKGQKMTLKAYDGVVEEIAAVRDITKKNLLKARPFAMSYCGKEICSVDHNRS